MRSPKSTLRTSTLAALMLTLLSMAAPASAFTPAVGIPERACGALDATGKCTGLDSSDAGYASDLPDIPVTPPADFSDLLNRMSRLTQLAVAAATGDPEAMKAYLAELRKPMAIPQPSRPTPRLNRIPHGKIGGSDLAANWIEFSELQSTWASKQPVVAETNPPPNRRTPKASQPPPASGERDDIEGVCHFEFRTSTNTYLCWRVDHGYRLPSGVGDGANCEASNRGRYRGYPVKYCTAVCELCNDPLVQTETVVNDAVEEEEIMSDPAG